MVVMSDWYAARSTEAAGAGPDLVMPGPGRPWGDQLVAAVRRRPRAGGGGRRQGAAAAAGRPGGGPGGDRPAVPPVAPWPDAAVAAELRERAAAGFVLLRNTQVEAAPALPLDRSAPRRVAVLGPNAEVARTLGGGSATVFPPYTVSPSRACGPGSDRASRSATAGVRSTDRLPVALAPAPPSRTAAAKGSGCGSWPPTAPSADTRTDHRRLHLAQPLRPRAAHGRGRRGRGPHPRARLRDRDLAAGCLRARTLRLTVAGQVAFDTVTELPEGADPVEGLMRPPQQGVPVELQAGEEVPVVPATGPRTPAGSARPRSPS